MSIIIIPLLKLMVTVCNFIVFTIFARIILSWLMLSGIVNTYSYIVSIIHEFLYRVTEPLFMPIRKVLPHLSSIDIAPFVCVLIIYFLTDVCQSVIVTLIYRP